MPRTIFPEPERKQLGVKVSSALWRQVRIIALQKNMDAALILDDAMREYIERHKNDTVEPDKPRRGKRNDQR